MLLENWTRSPVVGPKIRWEENITAHSTTENPMIQLLT